MSQCLGGHVNHIHLCEQHSQLEVFLSAFMVSLVNKTTQGGSLAGQATEQINYYL